MKSKPEGWFISRLVLSQSGRQTVRNQLVAERQAEMIESMFMRLAGARQFEASMSGLLIPEVGRQYDLLDRMLVNHFRVLHQMGLEPKQGSMSPAGAPAAENGTAERLLIQRIVDLPSDQPVRTAAPSAPPLRLRAQGFRSASTIPPTGAASWEPISSPSTAPHHLPPRPGPD